MDKNQKPDSKWFFIRKVSSSLSLHFCTDGNQKDAPYSPTKDLAAGAYLNVDRIVKIAEAGIRADIYESSMHLRRGKH